MREGVELAAAVAHRHLADELPRRWDHVQAVATKAARLGDVLALPESSLLVSAAWLHDIGYAASIRDTGFHSLDGARWLLREGFSYRLASLVAHHSCAAYEAEVRGLGIELADEFEREESPVSDALWFADMTTGPDGQDFTAEERLAEIRERYGPDHLVTRFWDDAERPLLEAVKRTEARMSGYPM
ncbi:HD domain-containing protein [Micromonospora chokoriensis]|uniref:HD domain-containing protein n=1 Tax=Micromonospora chokoriensis TaxID=356851 RepID=UPI0004C2B5F5|nr:HD domain-containing protein [Micromonospora chokoriensis]